MALTRGIEVASSVRLHPNFLFSQNQSLIPNSYLSRTRNKNKASISVRSSTAVGVPSPTDKISFPGKSEADVIVIGSGIGGLCCASLLARYGEDVLLLESHDQPGGAAHSFEVKGYKFDSGPSLFSGFQSRGLQANPLAQVNTSLFMYCFVP